MHGPSRWSSGQSARLLILQSEFESRIFLYNVVGPSYEAIRTFKKDTYGVF